MKDPNLSLRNAYETALAGMTFGSVSVPVYSMNTPLSNVPKKYVLLTNQTKVQNKTKCGYWYDCTITVDIVTRYPNGAGDVTFAMVVGEEIASRVQDSTLSTSDFSVRETVQINAEPLQQITQNENIYRYILIFQHKLNRAQ